MAKLEDVCLLITDGSHFSPKDIGEGFPMLSVKDMGDRDFSFSSCKHISKTDYDILVKNGCKPKKGDVLVAKDGSYFKYAFQIFEEREIVILSSIAILRPKTDMLDAGYLREFLMADSTYSTVSLNYISGTALKRVILQGIKKIQIPLPPLDEQRKIAAVLDKVNDLITKRRQQLDKLDELIKARFVEMFGDPLDEGCRYQKVPLGVVADVGSSKRIFEKEYVGSGVPFYRTKEIVELSKGHIITTELFITKERFAEICDEYGAPQKGDLLISAVGTIGVIWIVDGKNDFYFKDGNLLRVSVSNNFNPVYLKMLLETLIAAHKQKMSVGTAYAALTISMLKEMMVYLVPIDEQNQFAAFVEQTEKTKTTISESLQQLETLKKALMQEYFG